MGARHNRKYLKWDLRLQLTRLTKTDLDRVYQMVLRDARS
jgi:hypothetical protein